MLRRKFLTNVSKAGVLSGLGLLPGTGLLKEAGSNIGRHEKKHSFLTEPYLQNPASDSMSIVWISSKPCYSWVEYGEEKLDRKAHALNDGLVQANNRINCISLSGLKPATTYNFRVASKEITYREDKPGKIVYGETIYSDQHSFTTPSVHPTEVSCLIMNDIHDRPQSIPHLMGLNGQDYYDFVFFNGDMFNNQVDEQQIIDHMLQPCTTSFASSKPFMMVRGNHETRGPFSRELKNYFSNKSSQFYYDFTWGPVHFLVLDTGEDKEDSHEEYYGLADFDEYRRRQAEWAEQVMQTSAFQKAAFRVVFMHIPHFYSNDWHGTNHCRELFAPLFNKYHVDISISGHTHRYGVYPPVASQHHHPIIIGGGPLDGKRTLIKLKADSKTLKVNMLGDDGTEVGNYTLNAKR